MLFNSYVFLLGFLPVVLLGFFLLGQRWSKLAAAWLALASVVFYGWWNPKYVPLLLGSIVFNYFAGLLIARATVPANRRWLLTAAIGINLLVLGYYKYAGFFVNTLSSVSGHDFKFHHVLLPLGISFFTFTQIAYLVDTFKGKVMERSPVHYLLFVTYFPHLIAGPVIHHKDVMPQFAHGATYRFNRANACVGASIFILGLFKKCFLADGIAVFAGPVFKAAHDGLPLDIVQSWAGALAYTCQLYFDFSGYSDMAIGLSLLVNIRLPLNFNSPYKATNIIEFWKRWHISLSTFLRDYLYIPLGGNRHGTIRRYINLLLTMLIGGLWHGAGWTFVVWGGLHGFYLIINHAWRAFRQRLGWGERSSSFGTVLSWLITFLSVVVAWVFFRADSFHAAANMLSGMIGTNGVATVPEIAGNGIIVWGWIASLLVIALTCPNTQEFARRAFSGDYVSLPEPVPPTPIWQAPALRWALGLGALAGLAIMNLSQPAEFLYFNF